MNLFVDTSVWSLALRRDRPSSSAQVEFLSAALASGDAVFTTGLVLQELLQGFQGPRARDKIVDRFTILPFVVPTREDHIRAAELRNKCRRQGVQVTTIDALFAQLCEQYQLTMLTTDTDFQRIANVCPLRMWQPY